MLTELLSKNKPNYSFVLGCPRSGTSFLMRALNTIPNSECISGNHLPISVPHMIGQGISSQMYDALAYGFFHSLDNYLSSITNSQFLALQRVWAGDRNVQEFLKTLERRRKVEHLIYKEPFLAFSPEFTFDSLPNCKVIHIYRDGRDCADSLVRSYGVLTDERLQTLHSAEAPIGRKYDHRYVPWWVESGREDEFIEYSPYIRAIWMWKEMVRRCHDFFSQSEVASTNRILLLKYEDFMNDPLKYGESIADHLDFEMNGRFIKALKQARTRSIGIHKRRESSEIMDAEQIAKDELSLYGYL